MYFKYCFTQTRLMPVLRVFYCPSLCTLTDKAGEQVKTASKKSTRESNHCQEKQVKTLFSFLSQLVHFFTHTPLPLKIGGNPDRVKLCSLTNLVNTGEIPMTDKTLDTETRIKLIEIAAKIAMSSVGGACAGYHLSINETFEKCHESVLKRFNVELEQENS